MTNEERLLRFKEMGRRPKDAEQRYKMSLAKEGVPKSEAHKENMRQRQLKLQVVFRAIQKETGLSYADSKREYSRRLEAEIQNMMAETGEAHSWCKRFIKDTKA